MRSLFGELSYLLGDNVYDRGACHPQNKDSSASATKRAVTSRPCSSLGTKLGYNQINFHDPHLLSSPGTWTQGRPPTPAGLQGHGAALYHGLGLGNTLLRLGQSPTAGLEALLSIPATPSPGRCSLGPPPALALKLCK